MLQQAGAVVLEFGNFLSKGIHFFIMFMTFLQPIASSPFFWVHLSTRQLFHVSAMPLFLLICHLDEESSEISLCSLC